MLEGAGRSAIRWEQDASQLPLAPRGEKPPGEALIYSRRIQALLLPFPSSLTDADNPKSHFSCLEQQGWILCYLILNSAAFD